MGYCISLQDHQFVIPASALDLAYVAACELNSDASAAKHGGSSTGEVWFSWVDSDYDKTCKDLKEVLSHWRYEGDYDSARGAFVLEYFSGEKIGDEDQLFRVLALFVQAGSYMEFLGEDGGTWRWEFNGGEMTTYTGKTTWVED